MKLFQYHRHHYRSGFARDRPNSSGLEPGEPNGHNPGGFSSLFRRSIGGGTNSIPRLSAQISPAVVQPRDNPNHTTNMDWHLVPELQSAGYNPGDGYPASHDNNGKHEFGTPKQPSDNSNQWTTSESPSSPDNHASSTTSSANSSPTSSPFSSLLPPTPTPTPTLSSLSSFSSTSSPASTSSSSSTSATSIDTSLSTRPSSLTSQTHFVVGASTSTEKFNGPSITPTPSPNSVGGVSVSIIVGATVLGLSGLAALFAIGFWFLRWRNKPAAGHDFGDEYHTPRDTSSTNGSITFAPQVAPRISSPSLGGSINLASRGVMASHAPSLTGSGAYHTGHAGDPNEVEYASGAYSSQYDQYFPPHSGADYEEATRGYHRQCGFDSFEGLVNTGYETWESPTSQPVIPVPAGFPPLPALPSRRTTATPAVAARGPAPAAAERRNSAAYTEEDAYGGF